MLLAGTVGSGDPERGITALSVRLSLRRTAVHARVLATARPVLNVAQSVVVLKCIQPSAGRVLRRIGVNDALIVKSWNLMLRRVGTLLGGRII